METEMGCLKEMNPEIILLDYYLEGISMKRMSMLICFFVVIRVIVFATEPDMAEKYYIHDGDRILYLEMTVGEVKSLLGEPTEIKITRRNDPLHNFDIVTWVYQEIEIVFWDLSIKGRLFDDNYIEMIIIPNKESIFKIGGISPHGRSIEEIKLTFGVPKNYGIKTYDEYTYYSYTIPPLKSNSRAFVLQFRFNSSGICDEMFFASDTFF
jgi:hypothetical protein